MPPSLREWLPEGPSGFALREEDFGRVLSAGLALIIIGTLAYSVGGSWSIVDGLYWHAQARLGHQLAAPAPTCSVRQACRTSR